MLTPYSSMNVTHQSCQNDHDLTELSWLTRSNIFGRSFHRRPRRTPMVNRSLPTYPTSNDELPCHRPSTPSSLDDSSDSEHDNDSSSLNSSSERVTHSSTDSISPPHSALCFWILFALEDSKTYALTLNEICDWIEHHIERESHAPRIHTRSSDEQLIHTTRLKSKIRYHMTKHVSFFTKITVEPFTGVKLRYPLWTTDRAKRSCLLDALLTMNTTQLSLYTKYTVDIYARLCSERQEALARSANDENSCPRLELEQPRSGKRDKAVHRLASLDESNAAQAHMNNKRKKGLAKVEAPGSSRPTVEVVDAALALLLLRQPK